MHYDPNGTECLLEETAVQAEHLTEEDSYKEQVWASAQRIDPDFSRESFEEQYRLLHRA